MLLDRTVFKMYVKQGCPFCDKAAEKITKDLSSTLHTIDITDNPQVRQKIIEETGHKTVPAIWVGDEFIGGCDDLFRLCEEENFIIKVLREEVNILRNEVIRLRRSL
jgi:glutaredoxin 3